MEEVIQVPRRQGTEGCKFLLVPLDLCAMSFTCIRGETATFDLQTWVSLTRGGNGNYRVCSLSWVHIITCLDVSSLATRAWKHGQDHQEHSISVSTLGCLVKCL